MKSTRSDFDVSPLRAMVKLRLVGPLSEALVAGAVTVIVGSGGGAAGL